MDKFRKSKSFKTINKIKNEIKKEDKENYEESDILDDHEDIVENVRDKDMTENSSTEGVEEDVHVENMKEEEEEDEEEEEEEA